MNWTIKLVKSITRSSRSTSVPPRFKRQGKHLHFSSQRPSRIRWQVCPPHLTTLASSIHICCHIATHLQPRRQKDRQGGKPVLVSPSTLIVVRLSLSSSSNCMPFQMIFIYTLATPSIVRRCSRPKYIHRILGVCCVSDSSFPQSKVHASLQ